MPQSTATAAAAGPGARQDSWALALMLALTFSTGVVDAVGYLGLDRVFTGNMTGNVVILGMALTGAADLPVLGPVVALVAFLAGALLAGRVLRGGPAGWTPRTSLLLLAVGLVLAGLAVALAVGRVEAADAAGPVPATLLVVTGALGLVMGVQAAAARRVAVKDVTTVVVTSTLTALAADSRLAGGSGTAWRRRAAAVALILLGAAAGAALLRWHLAAGLGLSALVTLVVVALGHTRARTASD